MISPVAPGDLIMKMHSENLLQTLRLRGLYKYKYIFFFLIRPAFRVKF